MDLLPFLLQGKLACTLPDNGFYRENPASLGGAERYKKQVLCKEDSRARKKESSLAGRWETRLARRKEGWGRFAHTKVVLVTELFDLHIL